MLHKILAFTVIRCWCWTYL